MAENEVQEVEAGANVTTRRALETMVAVGQRLTSMPDLDTLLDEIVALIKARHGYSYVGIFLLDEAGPRIRRQVSTGETGYPTPSENSTSNSEPQGLIGWAIQNHQSAWVHDVLRDERNAGLDLSPDFHSELVLPLEVSNTLLGVLDLQSSTPEAFDYNDVMVFQSLAAQIAIAIQNAMIYTRERSRRLLAERLYNIGRALSQTLDLEKVLELILDNLGEIVPYDRGSVMLSNGTELEILAARGFPSGTELRKIRVGITDDNDLFWQIYRTQQPLLIPDVNQWPSWVFVKGLPPAHSWLGVPFIHSGEVIGQISLARETPTPYTQEDATLASAFAGQAGVALENARLYANVTRAYEQLERLDRTKSDFINVAAHELRTPLTVLLGSSQIMLTDPEVLKNPLHEQMLGGIYNGAKRLQEIVNSMLDMAKIDSRMLQLYMEPLSVAQLIEETRERFTTVLKKRSLKLTITLPTLPQIEGDANELEKVFYHLISNAVKYTPDGGSITISGHEAKKGQSRLPTEGIEIIVSDTGIGIDPEFHELVFTKFYHTGEVSLHSSGKTKFKGGGAGLGLAIAKGIVEAHGGHLWVESPGYNEETCPGSQFHVLLPLRAPTQQKQSEETA